MGTADGFVDTVRDDGRVVNISGTACGGGLRHLDVADDGKTVLPLGDGTGMLACSVVLRRDPGGWQAQHNVVDLDHANNARAGLLSASGGSFAIGYADGTIVIQPTDNILPWAMPTNVHERIWQLLRTQADDVYVATNRGQIAHFALCDRCVTNRALADEAGRRLDRAVDLGLATSG